MTKEERLDWLCRLRSSLDTLMPYGFAPNKWESNFTEALNETIQELENDTIVIPKDATIGDIILELLKGNDECIYPVGDTDIGIRISTNLWNTKYKKEG